MTTYNEQLKKAILKYLNNNFSDLTQYNTENSIVFKNNNDVVLMEYFKIENKLFISYRSIWIKLQTLFVIDYFNIANFINLWFTDSYSLGDTKNLLIYPRI